MHHSCLYSTEVIVSTSVFKNGHIIALHSSCMCQFCLVHPIIVLVAFNNGGDDNDKNNNPGFPLGQSNEGGEQSLKEKDKEKDK